MPVTKSPERRVVQPRKASLRKRLARIEGQVRGVARMVEEDRYCVDILVQLAAIRAALEQVGLHILEDHMAGCVQRAMLSGQGEAALAELSDVLRRWVGR